jgi:uncharacterized protein (DUF2225 family)
MRDQYDNDSQKKLLRVMISIEFGNLAQQTITNVTTDPICPFIEAQQDFQSISIYTRNQSMALWKYRCQFSHWKATYKA